MNETNFTENFFWFALGIVFSFITSLFLLLVSYEITRFRKKLRLDLLFYISIISLIFVTSIFILRRISLETFLVLSLPFLIILILWLIGILFREKVHNFIYSLTHDCKK